MNDAIEMEPIRSAAQTLRAEVPWFAQQPAERYATTIEQSDSFPCDFWWALDAAGPLGIAVDPHYVDNDWPGLSLTIWRC